MTLPLSRDRVLAALRRHSPAVPAIEDDDSARVKELRAIARPLGRVKDWIDGLLDELLPDSTTLLLERWERLLRIAVRSSDTLAERRRRLVAAIGRSPGNTLAQLADLLAPLLEQTAEEVIFLEATRAQIDAALTVSQEVELELGGLPGGGVNLQMGALWPGVIDGAGVKVALDVEDGIQEDGWSLTSPNGTVVPFGEGGTDGPWWIREAFTGERAAGNWRLHVPQRVGVNRFFGWSLTVSNEVDSAQIYTVRAVREPGDGSPDLFEAQRILDETAMAHLVSIMAERAALIADDSHSLVDREAIGV